MSSAGAKWRKHYNVLLDELRAVREDLNITQTGLAELLDRTQSWVSKVERGEIKVDVIELRLICSVLGVDFRDFVTRLDQKLSKLEDNRK